MLQPRLGTRHVAVDSRLGDCLGRGRGRAVGGGSEVTPLLEPSPGRGSDAGSDSVITGLVKGYWTVTLPRTGLTPSSCSTTGQVPMHSLPTSGTTRPDRLSSGSESSASS